MQLKTPVRSRSAATSGEGVDEAPVRQLHGGLPLSFVENKGQLDSRVKYVVRGPSGSVFFTPEEVVFELLEKKLAKAPGTAANARDTDESETRRGAVVRLSFPGANPESVLEARKELPGKINILRGSDPAAWQTNIRTYAEVVYRNLYPGIDLVFSGQKGDLARKLVARPEGNIERVRMKYAGIESLELTPTGDIRLHTALGTIREKPPVAERETQGTTTPIEVKPRLTGACELGFGRAPSGSSTLP